MYILNAPPNAETCASIREQRVTAINANGHMTAAGLKCLAKLVGEQIKVLDLSGSNQLTDADLEQLSNFPNLREFKVCWQPNLTDAGLSHLRQCPDLERVDLMGTNSGDGVLKALTDRPKLRHVITGKQTTDAGLKLFHNFPSFKSWQGGKVEYGLMGAGAEPNQLTLDGPFTNKGIAGLAGLDGVFGLGFFWHSNHFTSDALSVLKTLPNLAVVSCGESRCDDEALRHIAAIPKLKMLLAQGAVATEAGFHELAKSKTLEFVWGRDWEHFGNAAFLAFSKMRSLKGLAINLKNVDDDALSHLPDFKQLTQLTPMNVSDAAFRHIAACERLEHLWCMYCRETGDAATKRIKALKLKSYYAGATQITDASLRILGQMNSLERLEFSKCLKITDAGVKHLAKLPVLRQIEFAGNPGVTKAACLTSFKPAVVVNHWS